MTSSLTSRMGTNTGADAADAQAGFLVADAQPNDEVGALTASGGPTSLDDQSTTQLVVGRESGPGYWTEDDHAETLRARDAKDYGGTVVAEPAEPTPLLEVNARTGRSTDDPECGIGIGEAGDPMFTLQAGKQHGVAHHDPARPVAIRGRDGGAQAELGDEPLSNALRAGDGGSSRQTTILAYEVDKERGVRNDEGVKVTETDVAPPLLADGDPAERTDRGLRVVQPFRKSRRAQDPTDDETWVEGDVANTLNTFDGGDVRASEVVVEAVGFTEGGTGQRVDDVAGTLTAAEPGETSARQNVVATGFYPTGGSQGMGDGREVAQPLKVGTSDGGPAPGAVAFSNAGYGSHVHDEVAPTLQATGQEGNQVQGVIATPVQDGRMAAKGQNGVGVGDPGDPAYTLDTTGGASVAAYPIGQDALRGGEGVAGTPSADAEGRVRLRDPGLGVYDDGDPAATVTAAGAGAVGVVAGAAHTPGHADAEETDAGQTLRPLREADGTEAVGERGPRGVSPLPAEGLLRPGVHGGGVRREADEAGPELLHGALPRAEGVPAGTVRRVRGTGSGRSPQERGPRGQPTGEPRAALSEPSPDGALPATGLPQAHVRRLTPLECERLQGFDDEWTAVDGAADSVRYRELGNAVCAAVSDWLAWRMVAYINGWRPA